MTNRAVGGLASFLWHALGSKVEAIRLGRAGYVLLVSGCSIRASFPDGILGSYFIAAQRQDGGWGDVEESLWCLGYLAAFDNRYGTDLNKGRKWLESVRLACGAFGKSERDQPRIPITALASFLVPKAVNASGLEWLASQWQADLDSPTQLTYKGAFFLLSQAHEQSPGCPDLVEKTIGYLCAEQEEDGGFGPWKGHPMGSDPWTTGAVLWGLAKVPEQVPSGVLARAADWLRSRQLPNGLWPYHYLDDGTSMALIGLSSVLPVLVEH